MRKRLFFIAPLALLGIAVFVVVGGEVVMQLWNWLLPTLFGWPHLSFSQALGLLALCRILFGGFGRTSVGSRMGRRMSERMERMSPEERERLRSLRSRCGFGPTAGDTKAPVV
jgi:hypothetical protein